MAMKAKKNQHTLLKDMPSNPPLTLFPAPSSHAHMTITDYNCFQGENSIAPPKDLLSTLPAGYSVPSS
ncbi:uncharacterized protein BDR25DRAFT_302735 [Lindgomyces ingoldianus]|uniref:Uncharacterized protein n=1 Tax=Lindgomyces ingoldianus TaxID=673940 RepID=A0ACB6R0Q9_9PLEO|nr:uncharacterized protein BDR25DRAFT_302735 [Lindgomyces ingoldianus]KAF2472622.1 hypothetical protein BDR25DRAFT_302735 [Lindgomyces ingoldianus]